MFEGLGGLTIVRNSGVIEARGQTKHWVITLKSDHPISMRVTAHDEGYKDQSYLRFEKLTEGGWVTIAYRLGAELPVLEAGRDTQSWAEVWGAEMDNITHEGCNLLGILGE